MKKVSLVLALLTFSFSSLANTVNYSHCADFIDKTNGNFAKTGFAFPFTLNEKGEIKTTNFNMNLQTKGKVKSYSASNNWGAREIEVIEDEAGGLTEIKIKDTAIDNFGRPHQTKTSVEFFVNNGKCIPRASQKEFFINGEPFKATLFDTVLCKNLKDFFDKNKKLAQCLDLASKENKEINGIFEKNGYAPEKIASKYGKITPILEKTAYSVEQKVLAGSSAAINLPGSKEEDRKQLLGMVGGSPVISAHMILSDCYEKGLSPTLEDNALWTTPSKPGEKGKGGALQQ